MRILLFSILILNILMANGQGWLPPITFPSGTQMCDNESFKLVLSDDFEGSELSNKWIKHISWLGMSPYDNESDWDGARIAKGGAFYWPDNVVVQGGYVI